MRGSLKGAERLRDSCVTNAHPSMGETHKAGNQEHGAQSAAGRSTGWRVIFPGASVGLNLFQVDGLVSRFFLEFGSIGS